MYMIMFVLDDPLLLDKILESWDNAGINGATIAETTGFYRRRFLTLSVPLRYSLPQMQGEAVSTNFTLFTVVSSEEDVKKALQTAEEITGDLDNPNTGVFISWPVSFVKGIPGKSTNKLQQEYE